MARLTKESIEAKIKAAEEKVVKTGKTYNAACEEPWYRVLLKMYYKSVAEILRYYVAEYP